MVEALLLPQKNTIFAKDSIVTLCKFKQKTVIGLKFQRTTMRFSGRIAGRGMLPPSGYQISLSRRA
jgi:hypothetical protein